MELNKRDWSDTLLKLS